MKQAQIVKVLAADFNTVDVTELNKLFRQKESAQIKYRFSGENLGYLGVTGLIKMLAQDGVKVKLETRTRLVRYEDIESVEKAKLRSERPVYTTPKKPAKTALELALEDDTEDDGDYSDLIVIPPKRKRKPAKPAGKSGSKFIPKEKK